APSLTEITQLEARSRIRQYTPAVFRAAPSSRLHQPSPGLLSPGVCDKWERHITANATEYLFSMNTRTPPTMTVDSGEESTIEVRGAFDDIEDISAAPTPFTPACDGHPLAPITGPVVVRSAQPGDVVAIDLVELTPFGSGRAPSCGISGCCVVSLRSR